MLEKIIQSFCLFLFLISLNIYGNPQAVKQTIHVGIYAPFSGYFANIGKTMENSLNLAKEELKSSRFDYTFFSLDQLTNKALSKEKLQQFINQHSISMLISEGSTAGLIAAKVAKENHIIHFSIASDLRIPDGTFNFLNWSPPSEQAAVMVNELKRRKIKSISLLGVDHPWANTLIESVATKIKTNSHIVIVANERFPKETNNFFPLAKKLKQQNADIYLIMAFPEDLEKLVNELRDLKVGKPITTIATFNPTDSKRYFNGEWYVDVANINKAYKEKFYRRTSTYPTSESGYASDSFNIFSYAVENAKTNENIPNNDEISKILFNYRGEGIMGQFHIEKNGIIYTKSYVKIMKDDTPTYITTN